MSDPVGPLEKPDITMYLADLTEEIRLIEELVFVPRGKPIALVRPFADYPESGLPRERVGLIASFLKKTPKEHWWGNIISFPRSRECYALWEHAIDRKVHSQQFAGFGDACIKQFWFLVAVSLVRGRVLFRREWFPGVKMRDVRSVRKRHAWAFGDDAFMELRDLPDLFAKRAMSAVEIDMKLTQILMAAAIQNKRLKREDDISMLLVGD